MGAFVVYTIKSAICLILFFVFNKMILSKETFHKLNRVIWLSVIILSLVIPTMNWSLFGITELSTLGTSIEEPTIGMSGEIAAESGIEGNNEYIVATIFTIYILVVLIMLIKLLISHVSVSNLIRTRTDNSISPEHANMLEICKQNMMIDRNIHLIVHDDDIAPFSWMSYIVISNNDLKESGYEIITHELAHIKGYDSVDIIFLNILTTFQWFNPASWLYKRALKEVHEYNADAYVLNSGVNSKEYQLLLIKKAVGQRFYSMTNNFNHSTLKNRITMMLREKSNRWATAKCLYAIPLALMTVAAFANQEISGNFNELSEIKGTTIFVDSEIVEEKAIETLETTEKQEEKKDKKEIPVLIAEVMPKFEGGNMASFKNWLMSQVTYPNEAQKENISGKVVASFTIEKNGEVSEIKIVESPHQSLSDVVTDIIAKSPKWTPGTQKGENVRVKILIPVTFNL